MLLTYVLPEWLVVNVFSKHSDAILHFFTIRILQVKNYKSYFWDSLVEIDVDVLIDLVK